MNQLKMIANMAENMEIKKMINGLLNFGCLILYLSEFGERSPDCSIGRVITRFPGIVLEVAHSDKSNDLPDLADYVYGSHKSIQMIVALDINHRESELARVLVWQMETIMRD